MNNHKAQVEDLKEFYSGKTVLVTGGFGFKGSWLSLIMQELGAEVFAYGLINDDNKLYKLAEVTDKDHSYKFSVDSPVVAGVFRNINPDIVFHLAAQPIVSEGFNSPLNTFQTNVLGTVQVLEAVRTMDKKVSVVNVTTDKVYFDTGKSEAYVEDDLLMGEDPYSSSKSCSELVTYSYRKSFFEKTYGMDNEKLVSTCRAGNVIGGGDFSTNRIIPDIARALKSGDSLHVRNPMSIRPYEHVLDAVFAYSILAKEQYENNSVVSSYNVGPNSDSLLYTKDLVDFFEDRFSAIKVEMSRGVIEDFKESDVLMLDSEKFRKTFSWTPFWNSKDEILGRTADWYGAWSEGNDMKVFTREQVRNFLHV